MNTVTNAESSYYTANVNGKPEKGPCVAMTPYGVIGRKGSYNVLSCLLVRSPKFQLSWNLRA